MTRTNRLLATAIFVAAVGAAPGAGPADWPQFRGPARDGVARGKPLPERIPEAGLPVLWRVSAGAGYSGVALVGEGVYTMGQDGAGQFLLRLDARTGEVRWRHRLGDAYRSPYGDGPRSTPVVHGERVFAIDADGRLHAVAAASGELSWAHDLSELGARIPSSGYASTPIVSAGRLIVEAGGVDAAYLAFDAATGTPAWRSGSDVAAYASPIEIPLGGSRHVVFFSGSGLQALSPEDGRPLWRYPWRSSCPATGVPLNSATPIHVPPDRILIASGYGENRGAALLRIRREGDRFATETLWTKDVLDSRINAAILVEDGLYGFHGGFLQAVDVGTGEELWRARGFERGSLIAAGKTLIVLGEQGSLAFVDASLEAYRERGRAQVLEGRSWTSPSLAGDRLYLRNEQELVCLRVGREGTTSP